MTFPLLYLYYVQIGLVISDQRKKIMNKMKQNQKQGVKKYEKLTYLVCRYVADLLIVVLSLL